MDKKTVGMIRFLKYYGPEYPTLREAAIAYMMDYSGCERKVYTDGVIEGIIFEVFCDFIDSVDKPSMHLRQMQESQRISTHSAFASNVYDYMLSAMELVQVRDDNNGYINGFTAEDFDDGAKHIAVHYLGNQGAEDVFKCRETGKVYVRQPGGPKGKNKRYPRVCWLTGAKWTGGYEAAFPIKPGVIMDVMSMDGSFSKICSSEKIGLEGQCRSTFPFSYECYKEIAEDLSASCQHSYSEWHKWICKGKPDNVYKDNWIYGDLEEMEAKAPTLCGNYLGKGLYLSRRTLKHIPTGKIFACHELVDAQETVLAICGYDYEEDQT